MQIHTHILCERALYAICNCVTKCSDLSLPLSLSLRMYSAHLRGANGTQISTCYYVCELITTYVVSIYDGINYRKKSAQGYNAQNKRRYLIYQKKKKSLLTLR